MKDVRKLVACETTIAIVIHLRYLSEAGLMYGGGADTLNIVRNETFMGSKSSSCTSNMPEVY